ncbi:MAG: hemerythrin domain-containing protein [Magnetospiraceae bacterium]
MIPFDDLHTQNHEIAELTKVLARLMEDREMCDTSIVGELFVRYTVRVADHMRQNAEFIYPVLEQSPDRRASLTAARFSDGEREIRRLFDAYTDAWFKKGLTIKDHGAFLAQTHEIFDLVFARIQAESEQLYPLARELNAA